MEIDEQVLKEKVGALTVENIELANQVAFWKERALKAEEINRERRK
jgi:hypothetical protein